LSNKQLYSLFYKTRLSHKVSNILLHYHALLYVKRRNAKTNKPFEKPIAAFYLQYKSHRLLTRLKHWRKTATPTSLMQVQYAAKPRNPE